MLTLHIEAATYPELLALAERDLGVSFNPVADAPAPEIVVTLSPATPMPAPAPAPVPGPQPESPKPRGRPRKLAPSVQYEIDKNKAAAAAAVKVGDQPSQAQVDNSASVEAVAPAAVAAPVAAPTATPSAAAQGAVTFDQMKAKLQAVAAKALPADGKDNNAPLARAAGIIMKVGQYTKVKDVQPQDFAKVVAECDKVLAS